MYYPHDYQYSYSTQSIYGQSDYEKGQLFKKLENSLPAVFSRQEAARQLEHIHLIFRILISYHCIFKKLPPE